MNQAKHEGYMLTMAKLKEETNAEKIKVNNECKSYTFAPCTLFLGSLASVGSSSSHMTRFPRNIDVVKHLH